MKTQFVMTDMLILEEFCNQRCAYCGGFSQTEFRFKPNEGRLSMPISWINQINEDSYLLSKFDSAPTIDSFFDTAEEVLQRLKEHINFPILKISGGEIFLYKRFADFIKKVHQDYNGIQLLTNATLLTERDIKMFSEMGNVYFQISLDGHTIETNFARSQSRESLEKILKNISLICSEEMGLEVNCVLTKYNSSSFLEFVKYLNNIGNVKVFPRPVRGGSKTTLFPTNEQITELRNVEDYYEAYSQVLPPRAYFDRVVSVLENRYRRWNCYVPFFILGVNNYGKIHSCIRTSELPLLGSVFERENESFKILEEKKQYYPSARPFPCMECIIQYEVYNLYTEGLIDIDELLIIPTFKVGGVLEAVQQIKKDIAK